jgi:hypothetical protein
VKRVVAAAALVAITVSGCGQTSDPRVEGSGGRATTGGAATSVTADGVYRVGVDIVPGVYTTATRDCVGYTASKAGVGLDDSSSSDALLARAILVDGIERIVVHHGEFFTTQGCGPWHRENPGDSKSTDPATLSGGCEILLGGYELVRHVLWYLRDPTTAQAADELQGMLRAPVEAHNTLLAGPAGDLIVALDHPSRHVTANGEVAPDVTRDVAAIRHACQTS